MINPQEALVLILNQSLHLENEKISLENSIGRIISEDVYADRDFPPFDRVGMDGIAINYKAYNEGIRAFEIENIQYAGEPALALKNSKNAIEIMTGAVLPHGCDTVVRYEDLDIIGVEAHLKNVLIKQKQNIHLQGLDKKEGELLISKNTSIHASHIAVLASVGKAELLVKKRPKVAVISTGNELVDINDKPEPHQIRRSNTYSIKAVLENLTDVTVFHLTDDLNQTVYFFEKNTEKYDVFILSGGVSMGKKDLVIEALTNVGAKEIFYKIAQKPGKPIWVGTLDRSVVFALPGNPCSTYLCLHKYILPFLAKCLETDYNNYFDVKLAKTILFKPKLHYYLQCKLAFKDAQIWATPIENNGSGDFFNLTESDGFLEINNPEISVHESGTIFRFIPFHKKQVLF